MRLVWLVPFTLFLVGSGIFLRARRRGASPRPLSTDAVSGEWLAQARGREEHPW
jgi:cytochrome c-type biogenesis protein CcmH/NrfF